MSENYKPEISVVRRSPGSQTVWKQDDEAYPTKEPRALLIRGVPMVGDRVVWRVLSEAHIGTVIEYAVYPVVVWDLDGSDDAVDVEELSPAPDEDEALVERVARAMFEADHPDGGWDASGWDGRIDRETYRDRAKVAIKAMEKKP